MAASRLTKRAEQARLRWRCRRGMRELDVLLMRYIDEEYAGAGASERAAFVRLLSLQDPEILALLTGREVADDRNLRHVIECLLESH